MRVIEDLESSPGLSGSRETKQTAAGDVVGWASAQSQRVGGGVTIQ